MIAAMVLAATFIGAGAALDLPGMIWAGIIAMAALALLGSVDDAVEISTNPDVTVEQELGR